MPCLSWRALASFVGCNVMYLDGGTRDHFMHWLAREFPQLVDGYSRLYAPKYAPAAYRREVRTVEEDEAPSIS